MVEESLQEHQEIESLLAELKGMRPDDANWEAWKSKLDDLKEHVEHHVREEEDEFFPKAKSIVSAEQAREMGVAVEAAKNKLRGERSAYKQAS
jgi:hemerythrin-like domain-containing protein